MISRILRTIVSILKMPGLHRLPLFRPVFDRLRKIRIPFVLPIQGFRLKHLKLSTYIAQVHEPGTTALCKRIIKRGWTVLDLGAGDGYFTIFFSRLVGPEGKVFAFEVDEVNVKNLKANVERNGCRNVNVIPKAVANHMGRVRFFSADTKGTGSLFYENPRGGRWVEVDSISLDDYFDNYQKEIDFFKMDIEGGEAGAFGGMKNILSSAKASGHKLRGVVELSPYLLDSIGASSEKFLDQIRSYGFRPQFINDDGSVKNLSDFLLIAEARRLKHINFFIEQ